MKDQFMTVMSFSENIFPKTILIGLSYVCLFYFNMQNDACAVFGTENGISMLRSNSCQICCILFALTALKKI